MAEARGEVAPDEVAAFERIAPGFTEQPVTGSLEVAEDSIALELGLASVEQLAGSLDESPLLAELPSSSFAAFASADVGAYYLELIELIEQYLGVAATSEVDREFRRFEAVVELDAKELLGAIGDLAVFARGTTPLDLDGAALIETLDPALTQRALERLADIAPRRAGVPVGPPGVSSDAGFSVQPPGVPRPIEIAQRDDRIAVGYGPAAVEEAFEPAAGLEESDAFGAARGGLGDDFGVGFFLDVEAAVGLASLAAGQSPELQAALPYLERFTYLTSGGADDGERSSFRIVAGVE